MSNIIKVNFLNDLLSTGAQCFRLHSKMLVPDTRMYRHVLTSGTKPNLFSKASTL